MEKHCEEWPDYLSASSLLAEGPLNTQMKFRRSDCETRIDIFTLKCSPHHVCTISVLSSQTFFETVGKVNRPICDPATNKTNRNEYLNSKDLRELATKKHCCLDIYVYLSYRIAK
jgi:hypothetical protein